MQKDLDLDLPLTDLDFVLATTKELGVGPDNLGLGLFAVPEGLRI